MPLRRLHPLDGAQQLAIPVHPPPQRAPLADQRLVPDLHHLPPARRVAPRGQQPGLGEPLDHSAHLRVARRDGGARARVLAPLPGRHQPDQEAPRRRLLPRRELLELGLGAGRDRTTHPAGPAVSGEAQQAAPLALVPQLLQQELQ
jgi:hypothetical protein